MSPAANAAPPPGERREGGRGGRRRHVALATTAAVTMAAAMVLTAAGRLQPGGAEALAGNTPGTSATTATADGGTAPVAPAGSAASTPTVKIIFKINPPTRATVMWGKKRLGIVKPRESLVVERPRDSGPLDVVVHAEGCLPVHTRAYTFTSSVVQVKVTPLDKKNTLFGYREELPDGDGGVPGGGGGPDGGAPPSASAP